MALSDDIRTACASAVTALSETGWQWAAKTSAWDAETPTFGTAAALPVLATAYATREEEDGVEVVKVASVALRVADDGESTLPDVGDKLINAAGVEWIVVQLQSGAYGSRRYYAESIDRQAVGDSRGRVR